MRSPLPSDTMLSPLQEPPIRTFQIKGKKALYPRGEDCRSRGEERALYPRAAWDTPPAFVNDVLSSVRKRGNWSYKICRRRCKKLYAMMWENYIYSGRSQWMYTNLVMKAPRCDGEHFLSLTVSVWCFSSDDYEIESGQGNDTASVQRGRQTEHRPSKVLTTDRLIFFSDESLRSPKECQVFPLVIKFHVSGVYPCNL